MSKKDEKINDLQAEFNRIQESSKEIDINKYLAKKDDLPDLGEIQIYDYDSDVDESNKQADEVLEALVDLYLGDNPAIARHDYIIKKNEGGCSGIRRYYLSTKDDKEEFPYTTKTG